MAPCVGGCWQGRKKGEKLATIEALIVIDVQNDFCAGGALAVPDGDAVVPIVNEMTPRFPLVVLTQDWHPRGHASFASSHPGRRPFEEIALPYGPQVLWPDHCLPGTRGADFHPDLDLRSADLILRKGANPEVDSYSAFFENDHETPTGLGAFLRERGVRRAILVGLATDYCVLYTALDAVAQGFEAVVVEPGVRGIDLRGSLDRAWQRMAATGVTRVPSWGP
jgi:nicotinamidase/pyrazinamidase